MEFFVPGDHGCTFGGNPLACACGNAVMKALIDEDLLSHVDEMSAYLFRGLTELKEKYDLIEEVRGMGLLIGVRMKDGWKNPAISGAAEKKLLLAGAGHEVVDFFRRSISQRRSLTKVSAVLKPPSESSLRYRQAWNIDGRILTEKVRY